MLSSIASKRTRYDSQARARRALPQELGRVATAAMLGRTAVADVAAFLVRENSLSWSDGWMPVRRSLRATSAPRNVPGTSQLAGSRRAWVLQGLEVSASTAFRGLEAGPKVNSSTARARERPGRVLRNCLGTLHSPSPRQLAPRKSFYHIRRAGQDTSSIRATFPRCGTSLAPANVARHDCGWRLEPPFLPIWAKPAIRRGNHLNPPALQRGVDATLTPPGVLH